MRYGQFAAEVDRGGASCWARWASSRDSMWQSGPRNVPEWVRLLQFAVARISAVLVTINPARIAPTWLRVLCWSNATRWDCSSSAGSNRPTITPSLEEICPELKNTALGSFAVLTKFPRLRWVVGLEKHHCSPAGGITPQEDMCRLSDAVPAARLETIRP